MNPRVRMAILACALALGAGDALAGPISGAAPQELPLEGMITDPDWAQRPSGDDVSRFYPPVALAMRLSGFAEISCGVMTSGVLTRCFVVSEVPRGLGFGPATISLSQLFLMRPRLLDGHPVTGGSVRIPIRFLMDEDAEDAGKPSTSAAPAAVSPTAMALARRLVSLWGSRAAFGDWLETKTDALREAMGGGNPNPEQQLVLDSLQQSAAAALPARAEQAAKVYAASMPEPVLAQVVAFLETPVGRAWAGALEAAQTAQNFVSDTDEKDLMVSARRRLCARITCLPQDASPAPARSP